MRAIPRTYVATAPVGCRARDFLRSVVESHPNATLRRKSARMVLVAFSLCTFAVSSVRSVASSTPIYPNSSQADTTCVVDYPHDRVDNEPSMAGR